MSALVTAARVSGCVCVQVSATHARLRKQSVAHVSCCVHGPSGCPLFGQVTSLLKCILAVTGLAGLLPVHSSTGTRAAGAAIRFENPNK